MSAPAYASCLAAVQQMIAGFAVHALWQVPLLSGAAWCAIRLGRPHIRVAYRVWCGTLLLCVLLPLCSAVAARSAALRARQARAEIRLDGPAYAGELPLFQRESGWVRLLRQHVNGHGVQPVAYSLPRAWAGRIAAVYLLVLLATAMRLAASWIRMRRIVHRASPDGVSPAIQRRLQQQCEHSRMKAPPRRLSREIQGPAVAGALHPVLLLPESAIAYTEAELDAVLAHELAHIRRGDPLMHTLCSCLLVPAGFHPVALWVAARIRQTREMACDSEAAGALGSAEHYAESLLRIAESAAPDRASRFAAGGLLNTGLLGMFNTQGTMEERMQMLMNGHKGVIRGRGVRTAGCIAVALAAVLVAGMVQVQPALAREQAARQSAPARPSAPAAVEIPAQSDAPARLLSGEHARQQLRHAQRQLADAQKKATTDEERNRIAAARDAAAAAEEALAAVDGSARPHLDIQIDGIDTVRLHAMDRLAMLSDKQRADLARLQQRFNSAEFKADMDRALQLHVEALTAERLRLLDRIRTGEMQERLQEQARQLARLKVPDLDFAAPFQAPAQKPPMRISSNVLASNNLSKVNPVYPAEAKQKHLSGAVVLHVLVDETGTVEQVSVVSSPDPMLAESAIAAVKQWTYRPYLLNGNPIPVDSAVTVTYTSGQ